MSAAYFHCHSGISGDMILGALLDLGVPLEELREALAGLRLQGYQLRSRKVKRGQLGCTQVLVDAKPPPSRKGARHAHAHVHRNLQDIQKLIRESGLPTVVQTHALAIFEEIAKAEAKVHRTRKDRIHFHEVGAVDSIVDIVGGAWALHRLNISRVLASPLNTGQGTIECEHGLLPVPAPATLELLRGIPCYSSEVNTELTTPTGAAFIRHYAAEFGPLPLMVVEKTGYGAGSKIIPEIANCLRIILGQEATGEETDEEVRVSVIETNIDDMNPELFDHIMQGLLALGAVDVYFTPVSMKKNRPAVKLTVLAARKDRETLCRHLLKETSTFGVRWWPADRMVLPRDTRTVATPYGKVRVKRGWMDGRVVHTSPEYEDCRHLAEKGKRSILEVYDAARRCAWDQLAAEEKRGKE